MSQQTSPDFSGALSRPTGPDAATRLRTLELEQAHSAEQARLDRSAERTRVWIQYGFGTLAVALVSGAVTLITAQMSARERESERIRADVAFAHGNFWKAIELYGDAERRAPVLRFLQSAEDGSLSRWAAQELERDAPARQALEAARLQAVQDLQVANQALRAEREARQEAETRVAQTRDALAELEARTQQAEAEMQRARQKRAELGVGAGSAGGGSATAPAAAPARAEARKLDQTLAANQRALVELEQKKNQVRLELDAAREKALDAAVSQAYVEQQHIELTRRAIAPSLAARVPPVEPAPAPGVPGAAPSLRVAPAP